MADPRYAKQLPALDRAAAWLFGADRGQLAADDVRVGMRRGCLAGAGLGVLLRVAGPYRGWGFMQRAGELTLVLVGASGVVQSVLGQARMRSDGDIGVATRLEEMRTRDAFDCSVLADKCFEQGSVLGLAAGATYSAVKTVRASPRPPMILLPAVMASTFAYALAGSAAYGAALLLCGNDMEPFASLRAEAGRPPIKAAKDEGEAE